MTYPTPLEQAALNPHGFDYGDRVVLPDGRLGTVSRAGFQYCHVEVDDETNWKGSLLELRPYSPGEEGRPRLEQLSLAI